MGLATLSRNLRRHLAPKHHKSTHTPPFRFAASHAPFTRRSIKHLTPESLLTLLSSLSTPLTHDQVSTLALHISAHSDLLESLVHHLVSPPLYTHRAPRTRLPYSWIIATLFRFGPPTLRDTLSSRPDLLRKIASVFAAPAATLDPALATNAADVLRSMLHDYPRETATALQQTSLPQNLVSHIALQPAADFLPRLISHRVFSSLTHAPFIPMHKRAIILLGKAHVQDLLATAFVRAASEFPNASAARRVALASVLNNASATMAELCARALCLQRKYEDVDERNDAAFALNLQVITSHEFNDVAKHLTLVEKPAPLQKVLSAALAHTAENQVLLPAIGMVSSILVALRESRSSTLPSVRYTVNALDLSDFEKTMSELATHFTALLDVEGVVLGSRRLALVDLIQQCCELLSEQFVRNLLTRHDFCLLRRLLLIVETYRNNDVLQIRVAQMLHAVLTKHHTLATDILLQTNVLDFLGNMKELPSMSSALNALLLFVDKCTLRDFDPVQREKLLCVMEYYHEKEVEEDDSLSTMRHDHAKVSSDLIKDMDLEQKLAPNEDYGQELYMHHLLHEVSIGNNRTPPTDSHISQSTGVDGRGWGKRIPGRLLDVYYNGRHSK